MWPSACGSSPTGLFQVWWPSRSRRPLMWKYARKALAAWWSRLLEMPQELWHTGLPDENGGEPGYQAWQVAGGEYFRLRYRDGCQFVINRDVYAALGFRSRSCDAGISRHLPVGAGSGDSPAFAGGSLPSRQRRGRGRAALWLCSVTRAPENPPPPPPLPGWATRCSPMTSRFSERRMTPFGCSRGPESLSVARNPWTYLYGSPTALPPVISHNVLRA